MNTFLSRKTKRKYHYLRWQYGWKLRSCTACYGRGKYDHDGSPDCAICGGSGREHYPGPKAIPSEVLHKQFNVRCTQTVLEAFGIKGKCPMDGVGVVQAINQARIKWRIFDLPTRPRMTVQRFVKQNPTGVFYLSTKGHAMALVNGELVDATGCGPDKRWVESVIKLHESEPKHVIIIK